MTVSREYALDHFDEICDRAESGEEIMLERPGKALLKLVPRQPINREAHERAIDRIREHMLSQPPLKGVTIRELIEEGRRY